MTSVLGYARTFFIGGRYRAEPLADLTAEVTRFHTMLEDLGQHLARGTELKGTTEERLLQGPLADTMTHAGQLAMLRRLAGSPVHPENFIEAAMDPAKLGVEQPEPVSPDAEWPEAPSQAQGQFEAAFSRRSRLHLSGRRVSSVEARNETELEIRFDVGAPLIIRADDGRLSIRLGAVGDDHTCALGVWPTVRQREYLEFIAKYIGRFGRSPAEADIQRHFLVSAPAVNTMVRGLERRGFIQRQPGVPRSIRLVAPDACPKCGASHHVRAVAGGRAQRRRQ